MNKELVLVLGGVRSGKSSYALREAEKIGGEKALVATAEPLDDEMKERIAKHKTDRSGIWDTIEEPLDIAETLERIKNHYNVVVIDCLTLWLSNLMGKWNEESNKIQVEMDKLAKSCLDFPGYLYLISNEVGMGIVPDNRLARRFRDRAGELNKQLAQVSDKVIFMHAGIPVTIKGRD